MDFSGAEYLLQKHVAPLLVTKRNLPSAEEIRILAVKQTLRRIGGRGKKMPKYALATIQRKYQEMGSLSKTAPFFGISKEAIRRILHRYNLGCRQVSRRGFRFHNGVKYTENDNGHFRCQKSGKFLHRVIWGEQNGPIPKGHVITSDGKCLPRGDALRESYRTWRSS